PWARRVRSRATSSPSRSDRAGRRTSRASRAGCDEHVRKEPQRMNDTNLDFLHLIREGAISTYPLIACSLIVLGIVFERLWALRGTVSSVATLTEAVVPLVGRGGLAAAANAVRSHAPCPARRVFGDLLGVGAGAPVETLERVADERQFEEVQGAG